MRTKVESGAEDSASVTGIRQIRVVWPETYLQVTQYNGFRVGPIEMTVDVLPSETPREAYDRVWKLLDSLARDQFKEKFRSFVEFRNSMTANKRG